MYHILPNVSFFVTFRSFFVAEIDQSVYKKYHPKVTLQFMHPCIWSFTIFTTAVKFNWRPLSVYIVLRLHFNAGVQGICISIHRVMMQLFIFSFNYGYQLLQKVLGDLWASYPPEVFSLPHFHKHTANENIELGCCTFPQMLFLVDFH